MNKANLKTILLSFSLILIITIHISGQTFEKYIRNTSDELIYDAQFIDSSVCIFPLNIGDFLSDTYSVEFFKMDVHSGLFIDSLYIEPYFEDYYFQGIFDFLKYNDSLFIGIGKFMKNDHTAQIQYIIHVNNSLQVIFDTVVDIPDINEKFQKTILNSTGDLVSVGGQLDGGYEILCEKSINGELIRIETYDHLSTNLITAIVDLPHKNNYHIFLYMGEQHAYDIIDKTFLDVDTMLSYPIHFQPIDAIINPIDTSVYYIAGKQGEFTYPYYNNLSFLKLETNGNYVQYIYPQEENSYYTYKCFSIFENYLYFGGVYPFTQSPPLLYPEQRWILLYKLNHDGIIIWQKFYKGEVNYMAYKLLATADGGALIFSTRYDWNDTIPMQRDLHILKIDSTGYYDPLTGTEEELMQMNNQILVYPNPVVNEVNFVLGLYSNLQLSIFNATGERVVFQSLHHSQTIDISMLPAGIYVYLLTGKNGFTETGKIIKE